MVATQYLFIYHCVFIYSIHVSKPNVIPTAHRLFVAIWNHGIRSLYDNCFVPTSNHHIASHLHKVRISIARTFSNRNIFFVFINFGVYFHFYFCFFRISKALNDSRQFENTQETEKNPQRYDNLRSAVRMQSKQNTHKIVLFTGFVPLPY